jgi:predicted 2-oxoglutarate/Fe(II)-dependent dioxygenase YbiX
MYAGYLDLTQPLYSTVDSVLDPHECRAYIARYAARTAELGTVIGRHGEVVDLEVRNNTRVMWDDDAEAAGLFARLAAHIPPVLRGHTVAGANPRLRLYRYGPGERHGAHWDTEVELPDGRRSLLTLVIYLNDDFEGGRTDFPELGVEIEPRAGRALLFQQRVVHIAAEVTRGAKYVLRSDVLFRAP